MVAIMGTSTCHVMNGDALAEVPGMCGVVHGGITPGLWGYEAGQSGVGDIFGWFVEHLVRPEYHEEAARRGRSLHEHLSQLAGEQAVGEHGLVVLDWHSGNRSVLVDHELSGVIVGLTLGTRPPEVYRALVEATAFGARKIVETFEAAGVPVEDFVVAGGLLRNPFVLQIYADVLRRPLHLIGSDQGPALGSRSTRRWPRASPRHPRRLGGDGQRRATRTRPTTAPPTPTTRCTRDYTACTTTSAAAATTSCTGCAAPRRGRSPCE